MRMMSRQTGASDSTTSVIFQLITNLPRHVISNGKVTICNVTIHQCHLDAHDGDECRAVTTGHDQ